ncbi:MAG: hypothetical protein ACPKQO_01680 [Nitrososphaeraceae archaeon]
MNKTIWNKFKKKYFLFLVFLIGFIIRIIPEIKAHPYPIGYDVINYYIPKLIHVQNLGTFFIENTNPYLFILYISNLVLNNPQITTSISISFMYGLFSISLYLFIKKITINQYHSFFVTIFVIIQIPVLRTSWDLHKDIFALTILFVIFYILLNYKIKLTQLVIILFLTIITIITDIMVSLLLICTLMIYFIRKKREFKYLSLLILGSYLLIFSFSIENNNIFNNIVKLVSNHDIINSNYNQVNLIITFVLLYIFILPTFIVGLFKLKNDLIYISLAITLIGSFSWIFISDTDLLLPDRWIILSTIFSSIISGYGITYLLKKIRKENIQKFSAILILSPFIIMSISYMLLSSDQNIIPLQLFSENIKYFVPMSMQFNSIDIKDNQDLIKIIDWININTENNATIIVDKHLRGWMSILLKENRTFQFNEHNINKNSTYIVYLNSMDKRSGIENLKIFGIFQIGKIS